MPEVYLAAGSNVEPERHLALAARELARAPGSPVVLKGDGSLDYRTVREVILELSKARVTGVSLAATRIEPGEAR